MTVRRPLALILTGALTTLGVVLGGPPASAVNPVTSTFSGTTVDGPTYARTTAAKAAQTSPAFTPHFRAIGFTVDTAGSYTFTQTSPTSGSGTGQYDGFADLYSGTFDPANPTTNVIAANDDTVAGSNLQPTLSSVTLATGTTYIYVASGYDNTTQGVFAVSVSGTGSATALEDPFFEASRATNSGDANMSDVTIDPGFTDDPNGSMQGYVLYAYNDSTGAQIGSTITQLGTPQTAPQTTVTVAKTISVQIVIAAEDASGSYAWSPVIYPLPSTGLSVSLGSPTALSVSGTVSFPDSSDTRPTLEAEPRLSLVPPSGKEFDFYAQPGASDVFGPLTPATTFTATATMSTGLEANPPTASGGTVTTTALSPLTTMTVNASSPTNAEHESQQASGPLRHYQALTLDVTAPGTFFLAGIAPKDGSWDDMLTLRSGAYDPTIDNSHNPTYFHITDPLAPSLPAQGLRSDDSGDDDNNLIRVTLPTGRYNLQLEPFSNALGSSTIYVQTFGGGAFTASSPGAPDAPVVTGATPGNGKAVVAVVPQGNTQGSPVTSYKVVASAPGHSDVTAAGASPVTVPGLTNGVTYTVRAASTNANGTGPLSLTGPSVTPGAIVASAPGVAVSTTGLTSAVLSLEAPTASGTDPVTGYIVTLTAGAHHVVVPAAAPGPLTVTGLTPNTPYAVSAVATSLAGTGPAGTTTVRTLKPSIKLGLKKGKLVVTTSAAGKALGKVKVRLLAKARGAKKFKAVSTKTTSAKGTFTFSTTPVAGTRYEAQLVIGAYKLTSRAI